LSIWSKISLIGIPEDGNSFSIRKAKMTNRMIVIGFLMAVSYIPVFIAQEAYTMLIQVGTLLSLIIATFVMAHNGKHQRAGVFLCFLLIFHLITVSFVIQGGTGRFYLIPVSIMGFILVRGIRLGSIIFATAFIGFFIAEFAPKYVEPIIIRTESSSRNTFIFNMIMIFLGTLYFIYQFIITNKNYENEILKQKQLIEHQHQALEETHKDIKDSIVYAKRIQGAILPPESVFKQYLPQHFILYKPKDIVAGDFYWLENKDDKVFFAACDCTGHGVPGAMVSVICNNALNRTVREYNIYEPGAILDNTRDIVEREFEKSEHEMRDGMDIALCSMEGMQLEYAGAQNPLVIVRNGEMIRITADKQPVGNYFVKKPFTTHKVDLQKDDMIFLFSDGYADQFGGGDGKKFKMKRFLDTLIEIATKPLKEQREILDTRFEDWRGDYEQIDDVCVIGVRV
jgi:serine phosphatase RsbU (regulator of sigma subunit)